MAWQDYERSLCSGCGHPRSETFAEGGDQDWKATPWACHACAAKGREEEKWQKQDGPSHGIYIAVTKREE